MMKQNILVMGRHGAGKSSLVKRLLEHVPTGGASGFLTEEIRDGTCSRMRYASLLQVRLETGRRNQIRVQLAQVGCPVVGDAVYGRSSPLIPRVALHAARLCFRHPRTGRLAEFRSELPGDFLAAQGRLRRGARPGESRSGGT